MKPSEVRINPEAQAAMDKELERLRAINTWDESKVREMSKVRAEARSAGKEVHFGQVAGICVEKNYELPKTDKNRKFKGRIVFLGDQVKTANYETAMFQDLGSSPASNFPSSHFML